ncbi:MAG: YbjN domain-containing protein [Planctomycetota bacterium]|jgi:hypothetical protein
MNREFETIDVVRGFLDASDFKYVVREDEPVIETGFVTETAKFPVRVAVHRPDERPVLVVMVYCPFRVAECDRARMAETIVRANYGFLVGGFDMDFSDGEIVFRSSMPVNDATPSEAQCRELVMVAVATMADYHRAFNRLIYGDDLSPAEAIAEVEL